MTQRLRHLLLVGLCIVLSAFVTADELTALLFWPLHDAHRGAP